MFFDGMQTQGCKDLTCPEGMQFFLCQACPVKCEAYLTGVGRGKGQRMSA
jgi:hypothetical protein